ncbi:hypothetical protein HMPREF3293_03142 [Christensenella minuta]|uniref:Uncharacterized protein n=1 Tax=Christensenella minuta TaxID=626937 RepID=A0A136Q0K8_9FIRM|nr:hypothetical protein HMPREF3293_03142 [Christensenella minuta]
MVKISPKSNFLKDFFNLRFFFWLHFNMAFLALQRFFRRGKTKFTEK